jgi:pyruvate-ferredoxin/flavodoxin oxidoreductase
MKIVDVVNSAWATPRLTLKNKVRMAVQQVADILLVEEQRKTSYSEEHLGKAMGNFGGVSLDLSAVAKVLGKGVQKSNLDPVTLNRVRELSHKLTAWDADFDKLVPGCSVTTETNLEIVEASAVAHLDAMATCFKLLRMAWLERNSKYQPSVHDRFFAEFTWENLSNEEVALCPPYVVTVTEHENRHFYYSTLLPLVTSGLPIKVILEKTSFQNHFQSFGRSTALRCSLEIEMLPVALKGVYVLQDTVARPQAIEHLKQGLVSPRPGIFSIFHDVDIERCHQAVLSRALPLFLYDPDKSEVFLRRFDLSENPETAQSWASMDLAYINANGKKDRISKKVTFADFAASEATFQSDFSNLPADQEFRALPIAEYLELSSAERSGKLPFVYTLGAGGVLIKKVPAMKIVAQTADKLHLWKSLCEVAGINNPYLTELEASVRAEAVKEKAQALADLRQELTAEMETIKSNAVANAMKNLASKLSGMSNQEISAALPVAKVVIEPNVTTKASVSVAVGEDVPYIESKLCTACDECVTIDPNIFAYDANKQAYIKNAKGGPYKNLLKASKKCSAKIIHPGKEW